MSRFATLALAAALSTFAVPALAATVREPVAGVHEAKGKNEKKFPMAAEEFKKHFAHRTEKARARMEEHISKGNLSKEKAEEVRAKFNAAVTKVSEKVDAVCADGTVTKEEAHEVKALAKSLMPHHGGHKHGDKHPALHHAHASQTKPCGAPPPRRCGAFRFPSRPDSSGHERDLNRQDAKNAKDAPENRDAREEAFEPEFLESHAPENRENSEEGLKPRTLAFLARFSWRPWRLLFRAPRMATVWTT
jgi:ElaB/YqjD/DUF883 family membrane-anchored ribosome-binding protein